MEGKILALACAVCFGLNPVMVRIGFTRAGSVDAAVIIGLVVAIPVYLALLPLAAAALGMALASASSSGITRPGDGGRRTGRSGGGRCNLAPAAADRRSGRRAGVREIGRASCRERV